MIIEADDKGKYSYHPDPYFTCELMAPGIAADEQARANWSAFLRHSASPGAAAQFYRMNMEIDVHNELPQVDVPTLIMHRTGDRLIDKEQGRYQFSDAVQKGVRYASGVLAAGSPEKVMGQKWNRRHIYFHSSPFSC